MFDELAQAARDFGEDFAANYRSTYWWADHPTLRIALLTVVAGTLGLAFHYAELRMNQAMGAPNAPAV